MPCFLLSLVHCAYFGRLVSLLLLSAVGRGGLHSAHVDLQRRLD